MSLSITFQNNTVCNYNYYSFWDAYPNLDRIIALDFGYNPADSLNNIYSTGKFQNHCGIKLPNVLNELFGDKISKSPLLKQKYNSYFNQLLNNNFILQKLDKNHVQNYWPHIKNIHMDLQPSSHFWTYYIDNLTSQKISPWFDLHSDNGYQKTNSIQISNSCGLLHSFFNASRLNDIEPVNKIANNLILSEMHFGTDCVYYFHYFDNIILNKRNYNSVINTLFISDIDIKYLKSTVKFWYDPYDTFSNYFLFDLLTPLNNVEFAKRLINGIEFNL